MYFILSVWNQGTRERGRRTEHAHTAWLTSDPKLLTFRCYTALTGVLPRTNAGGEQREEKIEQNLPGQHPDRCQIRLARIRVLSHHRISRT